MLQRVQSVFLGSRTVVSMQNQQRTKFPPLWRRNTNKEGQVREDKSSGIPDQKELVCSYIKLQYLVI